MVVVLVIVVGVGIVAAVVATAGKVSHSDSSTEKTDCTN